jgi:hypothetical protein
MTYSVVFSPEASADLFIEERCVGLAGRKMNVREERRQEAAHPSILVAAREHRSPGPITSRFSAQIS